LQTHIELQTRKHVTPGIHGVTPLDSPAFLLMPLVLHRTGLLGALAPAAKAMRMDPATALREE
jgi:hypothetical protein